MLTLWKSIADPFPLLINDRGMNDWLSLICDFPQLQWALSNSSHQMVSFVYLFFFRWFCWRIMGHTNAQIHKCTNSCYRLIKSSASLIEITHLCDGRCTIIWGYCVRRWQRVELEEGVEALKEVSSPQEIIETICHDGRGVVWCRRRHRRRRKWRRRPSLLSRPPVAAALPLV